MEKKLGPSKDTRKEIRSSRKENAEVDVWGDKV
jgi:hypothetical protein